MQKLLLLWVLMITNQARAYDENPCNLYQVVCIPELTTVEIRSMSDRMCAYGGHPFSEEELVSLRKQNIQLLNKYMVPEEITCNIFGRTIRVVGKPYVWPGEYGKSTLLLSIWDGDHKVAEDIPFSSARNREGRNLKQYRDLHLVNYFVSKYQYGGLGIYGKDANTTGGKGHIEASYSIRDKDDSTNDMIRQTVTEKDIPWPPKRK